MKHFTLFFLTLISLTYVNAQAPAIQWSKTYGGSGFEEAQAILQTIDGGYIVAGYTNLNSGDVTDNHSNSVTDFWVVKLSATGTIQWKNCYGGTADDRAYCIQQTTDGGYVIAGSSVSTDGDVTGVHINQFNVLWGDYWVIKISSTGSLQWQKTIGGTSLDVAQSIIQTTDGGYIVVGESYAEFSYDGDFVNGATIVKLTSTGTIEWVTYGGNYNYDVKQTPDGGYVVAGYLGGKFYILKLNSLGATEWQKFYGGSSSSDFAYSIVLTTDGGYMVAGCIRSSDGDVTGYHGGATDAWLLKLDSSGDLQWQKTLGGSYDDQANCVLQTADGGYIMAGQTNSNDGDVNGLHGVVGATSCCEPITDYWVVKITNAGMIQWQKTMGANYIDKATSIIKTTDGGYAIAGHVALQVVNNGDVTGFHLNTSIPNASGFDYWVVKLAPEILSVSNNLNNNLITVYPNPTSNLIHISGLTTTECNIKIINELGNTVANYYNTTNRDLDISNLTEGIYFLSIENSYFKIIKK